MEIKKVLERLGLAVGLTLTQMIAVYLLLSIGLFHTQLNVFLIYRHFFERFLFVFDGLYYLFTEMMYAIFGDSYLHIIGFNNVFKLAFFTIFLINIAYFFTRRCGNES